jgi:Protein of unknown function (DUF3800)
MTQDEGASANPDAPRKPTYHIFCDESHQNASDFMVFGAISVEKADLADANTSINQWRTARGMNHEIKWVKVHKSKLPEHESLLQQWFWLARDKSIFKFRAIVLDATKINYSEHHDGDTELGFYKFFYHFLLHSFGSLVKYDAAKLQIYFDQRESTQKLSTFKAIINNGFRKEYGCRTNVVSAVEAVDSHDANLIQIADLFMGAIGFEYNGHHLSPEARQAKVSLCKHIAKLADAKNLMADIKKPWFSVWLFDFETKKAT